jgi:hypothetical protein
MHECMFVRFLHQQNDKHFHKNACMHVCACVEIYMYIYTAVLCIRVQVYRHIYKLTNVFLFLENGLVPRNL